MTLDELQEMLINLRQVGADMNHVEVKRAEGGFPRRLWETLSAFANTSGGGVIILGIDEEHDFQVTGIRDPAHFQSSLASLCDQMEPPLRPLIQVFQLDGNQVIVAEIPEVPHSQKPCYYLGAGIMTGSLIRVADGDRRLTQYEIQVFLDNRGQPTYDLEPVRDKTLDDLDPVLIDIFLNRLKANPDAPYRTWDRLRLLKTFRILVEYSERLVPSLAGYLCFGVYPQDIFPSLNLTVVRYPTIRPGETSVSRERLLDNVKAEGPLVNVLRQAINAVTRNLQRKAVVEGLFRRDVWEYPLEAIREALVNALAHRDYSPQARGTPVQVRIFPDRIEIENPGGLFGPVTIDKLGEAGLLATRNTYLMRLLEDLPENGRVVCENRGTGITTMLEMLRSAGMEPPHFDDRHTTFRLTFSNSSLLDELTLQWLNRFGGYRLNDAQRLALAFVRREERLTNTDYRRLNPGLDSAEVTRQLADLVQQGLLRQNGARRWTFYTLAEQETSFKLKFNKPDLLIKEQSTIENEKTPIEQEKTTKKHNELPIELPVKQPIKQPIEQPIELPIELPYKAPPIQVQKAILTLCLNEPLSSRELGILLNRNPIYLLNQFIKNLVHKELLDRIGTAPTDPNLRYLTSAAGVAWLKYP